MAKAKVKSISSLGPISKKVLSGLDKFLNQKVVDIGALKEGQIRADNLEKTIMSEKDLAEFDPLHGVYAYGQNRLSALIEQLSELPEMWKLAKAYGDAEETYLPSGPPMSPLTHSYFFCWGAFDLGAGLKRESFATVAIDFCKFIKADPGLIRIFEKMQNSRMGFYIHEGYWEDKILFRELVTDNQIKAVVPSGYWGQPGQIWLARILPEPFEELHFDYSIVFITPYIILEQKDQQVIFATEENWLTFFERNLKKTGIKERKPAYEFFMKYGLERHYWNEYIFEAYVNHQPDMILLAGFPDIPLSRPHSRESQAREEW
jgi:hypothetical protein